MVSIFVNNQSIDLLENVSIPITYSIADIRNPEQRQGTFTKTIAIPGTKTNNKLFSHIFKISKLSNSTDFNPALKADCLILEDSIEILMVKFPSRSQVLAQCELQSALPFRVHTINHRNLSIVISTRQQQ